MLRFLGFGPLQGAARPMRAFLRVESLEGRAHPSGLDVPFLPPPDTAPGHEYSPVPNDTPPRGTGNRPPEFLEFDAREISNGVFLVTGRVGDESPGGLRITLGGVPSAIGETTVTESDGSFSMLLYLQTNGTDSGCLTASVTDDANQSDSDFTYVFPTAP